MEEPRVLWWIIGVLLSALIGLLGVALWMAQRWQARVEARIQDFHQHRNLVQWCVLLIYQLYRRVFGREPPDPPEER